jgi:hypothetical protein
MANKRQADLRLVDPLLTEVVRGYHNNEFIGENIFPFVQVDKGVGKIPLWGKDMFNVYKTLRAPLADSNEIDISKLATTSYETDEHDLAVRYDNLQDSEEAIFNVESHAANKAMEGIRLELEKLHAETAFNLATYGTDNKETISSNFYNDASVNFIDKIIVILQKLEGIIGKWPNTLVLGKVVWDAFKLHPKFKSYLVRDSNTNINPTLQMLADLLEIENIYVGKSLGLNPDGSFKHLWGNGLLAAYITPPTPGIDRSPLEPCFGYTFRKRGYPFADTYTNEGGKVSKARATDNYGIKVVGAESAYYVKNPIDPSGL